MLKTKKSPNFFPVHRNPIIFLSIPYKISSFYNITHSRTYLLISQWPVSLIHSAEQTRVPRSTSRRKNQPELFIPLCWYELIKKPARSLYWYCGILYCAKCWIVPLWRAMEGRLYVLLLLWERGAKECGSCGIPSATPRALLPNY